MANRVRRVDEATIAGRRLQADLGAELREARLARGLRQVDVARATSVSSSRISRVEHGLLRDLAIVDTARHGAAVGLRLHARFYPTGSGLRDAAQLDLLRRLRVRIGDAWSWQLEAPLNIPGDMRAFDLLLTGGGATIAVEAITRLRDAQAQLREATRKQRDGHAPRLVILLSATPHNRDALASAGDVMATSFHSRRGPRWRPWRRAKTRARTGSSSSRDRCLHTPSTAPCDYSTASHEISTDPHHVGVAARANHNMLWFWH